MPQPNNRQDEWSAEDGRDSRQRIKYMVEVAVKQAMEEHEVKVRQHLDSRFDELKSIMLSAFPENDPVKHREFHQKQIDFMNEKIALWKEIRSKSIVGILWASAGFVAMAILEYVKRGLLK